MIEREALRAMLQKGLDEYNWELVLQRAGWYAIADLALALGFRVVNRSRKWEIEEAHGKTETGPETGLQCGGSYPVAR